MNYTSSLIQQQNKVDCNEESTNKFQGNAETVREIDYTKISLTLKKKALINTLITGFMAYGLFHSIILALFASILSLILFIGFKEIKY